MALPNLRQIRGDVTLEQLSDDTGISVSQLSRYETGKRDPSLSHLAAIAARFQTTVGRLVGQDEEPETGTVPIVGKVGAGAIYIPFETDEPLGTVPAPEGANDNTVAAIIDGESLGALFDQWVVFYDRVYAAPDPSMIGKLCVVGLAADKRVVVKKLTRGQVRGLFTLLSNFDPPIYDVAVEWCAVVKNMSPR